MTCTDGHSRRPLVRPADWPDILRSEWAAARNASTALFQAHNPCRGWSENTWRIAAEGLGKLLAVLKDAGSLPDNACVTTVVTEEHLRGMVEKMLADGLTINTQTTYLTGVSLAARVLAPKQDWRWIRYGIDKLRALAPARSLVSQADISSAELLQIGKQRFHEACHNGAACNLGQAVKARDALMLALLAVRPLRRKNFADLRLDENIRVDEDRVRIEVPEHMMKGKKRAFNAEWPAALKSEFFRYRDAIRPLLLGGEHGPAGHPPAEDAFWISERGTKLTAHAIYRQVRQLAEEILGQKINLHKFRNIAASTLAIHDPAQINLAQPVLGHNDPRSKEFYIQANQLVAVRRSHVVEDRILNSAAAEERAEKRRQKPH